jgi:hypothetical protein
MTVKQNAKSAVKNLRDIADRIENGEQYSEANTSVELLFDPPPDVIYQTEITDSLDINGLKPTGYIITIKVTFTNKPTATDN